MHTFGRSAVECLLTVGGRMPSDNRGWPMMTSVSSEVSRWCRLTDVRCPSSLRLNSHLLEISSLHPLLLQPPAENLDEIRNEVLVI